MSTMKDYLDQATRQKAAQEAAAARAAAMRQRQRERAEQKRTRQCETFKQTARQIVQPIADGLNEWRISQRLPKLEVAPLYLHMQYVNQTDLQVRLELCYQSSENTHVSVAFASVIFRKDGRKTVEFHDYNQDKSTVRTELSPRQRKLPRSFYKAVAKHLVG